MEADGYDTVDTAFITQPMSSTGSTDLFSNLPSDESIDAYLWDQQPFLDEYSQSLLLIDEATQGGTYKASTADSNAVTNSVPPFRGASAQISGSGAEHDAHSSSEPPSAAASPKSNSPHSRLVFTHAELIALSESLAVSFSMTNDMDVIYRLSAEVTKILQRLSEGGLCYPPMPVAKCHGMTSLLILGSYSYLLEAYELAMEKLRAELRGTGSLTEMMQQRSQRATSPNEASRISIAVGGIQMQVSRMSAAEIHLQLISKTAQNLRQSLRQFVRHTSAPRCSMDLYDEDEGSPVSNHSGSCTGETRRGDTVEILTKLSQRELQRRENSIFQYINESAAEEIS